MAKTKKQRVRKKFNYHVNQKKKSTHLKNKLLPPIDPINDIKEAWRKDKSAKHNFLNHGLIYNLNKSMKPSNEVVENGKVSKAIERKESEFGSSFVKTLEKRVKLANEIKNEQYLSPKMVELLSYYMDKYGEDYKAMARDVRNYNQETCKAIRKLILKFKNCSEQYAQYLKSRNLL